MPHWCCTSHVGHVGEISDSDCPRSRCYVSDKDGRLSVDCLAVAICFAVHMPDALSDDTDDKER